MAEEGHRNMAKHEHDEFERLNRISDLKKTVAHLRYEKPTELREKWLADQREALRKIDENIEVRHDLTLT